MHDCDEDCVPFHKFELVCMLDKEITFMLRVMPRRDVDDVEITL